MRMEVKTEQQRDTDVYVHTHTCIRKTSADFFISKRNIQHK